MTRKYANLYLLQFHRQRCIIDNDPNMNVFTQFNVELFHAFNVRESIHPVPHRTLEPLDGCWAPGSYMAVYMPGHFTAAVNREGKVYLLVTAEALVRDGYT